MWKRVLTRLPLVVIIGTCVFIAIVILQVDFRDLRSKFNYRNPSDFNLEIGAFYVVDDTGRLRGPVCSASEADLERIVERKKGDLVLTNSFGRQLPLVAEWTKNLVVPLDETWTQSLSSVGEAKVKFTGHTLELKDVESISIKSFIDSHSAMNNLLWKSEECVGEMNRRYLNGECVVSIFKIVRFAGRDIGLMFHDEQYCYVRQARDGEKTPALLEVPRRETGLLAYIADLKVWTGLIDGFVPPERTNAIAAMTN